MAILDRPLGVLADTLINVFGPTVAFKEPYSEQAGKSNEYYGVKVTPLEKTGSVSIFRGGGQSLPVGGYKFGVSPTGLAAKRYPNPQPGWDMIKGQEVFWIIDVDPISSGDEIAYLECKAVNLREVLSHPQANQTITTQNPNRYRTPTGAWVAEGFVTVKTIQPAWVMPVDARATNEQAKHGQITTHRVFVTEDPGIGVNGRIIFKGHPYRVLDVVNELNADRLWIMNVEGQ